MADLEFIRNRIESKKQDYINYDFTYAENSALTTFFDLAQEFENIEDFYSLCVWIPNIFFKLDARLYLIDPKLQGMVLVAKTEDNGYALLSHPPDYIVPSKIPYVVQNSLVLPIRGNRFLIDQLPFKTTDEVISLNQKILLFYHISFRFL